VLGHGRGLFAVESGSNTGEDHSDTLWLETRRGWDSLLVQPDAARHMLTVQRRGESHVLRGGLCPQHADGDSVCYTMPQILSALGRDVIDYWSLDAGQDTFELLRQTDFSRVEVGLLTINVRSANENDERSVDAIRDYMEQSSFSRIASRESIDFFVNPCYIAKRRLPWPKREFSKCPQDPICGVAVSTPGIEQGLTGVAEDSSSGRFLVTSFDTGTSNEMASIADRLGIAMNIGPLCAEHWATTPIPCQPRAFTDDRVSAIWDNSELRVRLSAYRGVIVTANTWASNAFMGRKEFSQKPIIMWLGLLKEHFDVTALGLSPEAVTGYIEALKNASCCQKNVYIVAAHEAEVEFAKLAHRDMNTDRWRIIRPLGRASTWLQNTLKQQSIFGPIHSLCTFSQAAVDLATKFLQKDAVHQVSYNDAGRARGLSSMCRALLILPDTPSSLELWENARMGNVMFLPSASLLLDMMSSGKTLPMDGAFPRTVDFLTQKSDWYRPEQQPLFVYFSSDVDLALQFTTLNYAAKREQMRNFMDGHEATQLKKWKELFQQVEEQF